MVVRKRHKPIHSGSEGLNNQRPGETTRTEGQQSEPQKNEEPTAVNKTKQKRAATRGRRRRVAGAAAVLATGVSNQQRRVKVEPQVEETVGKRL